MAAGCLVIVAFFLPTNFCSRARARTRADEAALFGEAAQRLRVGVARKRGVPSGGYQAVQLRMGKQY